MVMKAHPAMPDGYLISIDKTEAVYLLILVYHLGKLGSLDIKNSLPI